MYSYRPPHMVVQKQDDQLELTYSNYVRTQDVTLKTFRRRWVIGRSGERESGISVLAARHDDDDDIHFLCSCYLDKHPSLYEQHFSWYQSPDEGYQNQNVLRWLYIKMNSSNLDYSIFSTFFINVYIRVCMCVYVLYISSNLDYSIFSTFFINVYIRVCMCVYVLYISCVWQQMILILSVYINLVNLRLIEQTSKCSVIVIITYIITQQILESYIEIDL